MPPSLSTVVEENIVQSPGVIGPMTLTGCADAETEHHAMRAGAARMMRVIGRIPRCR
jgi:hypothetical protein